MSYHLRSAVKAIVFHRIAQVVVFKDRHYVERLTAALEDELWDFGLVFLPPTALEGYKQDGWHVMKLTEYEDYLRGRIGCYVGQMEEPVSKEDYEAARFFYNGHQYIHRMVCEVLRISNEAPKTPRACVCTAESFNPCPFVNPFDGEDAAPVEINDSDLPF